MAEFILNVGLLPANNFKFGKGVSTVFNFSEQMLRESRKSRDNPDVELFINWLNIRSPFHVSDNLQYIASGTAELTKHLC